MLHTVYAKLNALKHDSLIDSNIFFKCQRFVLRQLEMFMATIGRCGMSETVEILFVVSETAVFCFPLCDSRRPCAPHRSKQKHLEAES